MKLNAIILINTTCYELILLKLCMCNLKQQLCNKILIFCHFKILFLIFTTNYIYSRLSIYKKNKCNIIMYNKDKENRYAQC